MRRNLLALAVATPWIFMAAVRVFALDRSFPLIPLVAFTPQVLVTMLLPLVFALLLRARFALVGIAVVAGVLLALLVPRAFGGGQPDPGGRTITIFSANLLAGGAEPGPLLAAIRETDPDIIALQEATPDNVELLRSAGLLKDRPYLAGEPRWGTLGYFTVSRFPLKVIPGSGLTDGQWPEMRVGGTKMIFRNVHPTPPISPFATPAWEQNLSEIPGPRGRLRVVAGDFNATFDHRDFRAVIARGYVDAGEATGNGFKWTWSAGLFRRLVIDHVLAPPSVRFSDYRVFNLPNSDHNAVAVKIQLPR